jgi:hypothetical protein
MQNLEELKAAAEKAVTEEVEAQDVARAARSRRQEAVRAYNVEAAREKGIEIGKTIVEAARYGLDYNRDKLKPCVVVRPSGEQLDNVVVWDVTSEGKLWGRRRPYTTPLDKVRVTDRTAAEE